jgi:nitroimidazol reductase NimA-like FMN-containing flavoprotein (pyridoxamine 5'-phosphate oxidase superfamily)
VTRALNESEAWAVISAGKLGHLGCIDQDEPYVVPINYYLSIDGKIYSHSLPGRKINALRKHPRACLQVDQIRNDFHWQSAIAFGDFEEITNPDDRAAILRQLLDRFPELTPVESHLAREGEWDVIVFCLRIDRVTGAAED